MPKRAFLPNTFALLLLGGFLLIAGSARVVAAAEELSTTAANATVSTNAPASTNAPSITEAQNQEMIRQAIEQIRGETKLAARQLVEEAERTAERNAGMVAQRVDETVTARLTAVERSIAEQYRRDREAMQESNRSLLLIAGCFGVVGVLGILTAAAIIVRAMNRLSEVALALPNSTAFNRGPAATVVDAGIPHAGGVAQLEQASIRFLGAIDRLEKRIHELELTAHPDHIDVEHQAQAAGMETTAAPAAAIGSAEAAAESSLVSRRRPAGPARAGSPPAPQTALVIGKGQTLLNLGQAEEALACFDEAIKLDPNNADALVKRGMALEKLQRMEDALVSYDRAIATNSSLTLAYLYKGAVCNRLQRFREALECYEKALKTEQKPIAS